MQSLPSAGSSRGLLLLQGAEMVACSRDSHKNNRIAVLRSDHSIASYDIATAKMVAEACDADQYAVCSDALAYRGTYMVQTLQRL